MTGNLTRLEERGLVERARAEADKRVQFITLTPADARLLRQAGTAGKDVDKGWPPQQRRAGHAH
jgi:DNA-binding MarR family transcriptional regulator